MALQQLRNVCLGRQTGHTVIDAEKCRILPIDIELSTVRVLHGGAPALHHPSIYRVSSKTPIASFGPLGAQDQGDLPFQSGTCTATPHPNVTVYA